MSVLGTFTKQPTEVLDYDVSFADWLGGRSDLPQTATTTVDPGLTLVSSTLIGQTVKVVLSGGLNGGKYKVTVHLTTDTGLVKEADFFVRIKEF